MVASLTCPVSDVGAWGILKAVMGIRVSAEEEHEGLDVGEHGISGYPEFHVSGAGLTSATMSTSAPRVGAPAAQRVH